MFFFFYYFDNFISAFKCSSFLRDATQSPVKSLIFSPLLIANDTDFGKI